MPDQREIAYPFASGFSAEEHLYAQRILERDAKRRLICSLMIGTAWFIFIVLKIATIHVSFVFLPLVLGAIFLQQWAGMRLWRVKTGGGMILWLRRFHREDLRQFPFGVILEAISGNHVTPITIQDSTYKLSWNSIFSRGVVTIGILVFSGVLAAAIITYSFLGLIIWILGQFPGGDDHDLILGLLCLGIGLALFLFIPYWLLCRIGYHRLKNKNAVKKINKFVWRIKHGRMRSALQIFQCGDEFWRDIVNQVLISAEAVVVDVTSVGENVRWELAQVRELVAPERIVLCCATQNGRLLHDEVELVKELLSVFGQSRLDRIRRVTYEVPVNKFSWMGRLTRDLQPFCILRNKEAYVSIQRAVTLARLGEFI